jgi:molecular chaperone HscB
MDHFAVFGLARRLVIDGADLQRRFHELSWRHHPDFHQGGSPEEQARSLESSARINAAYRILKDPIRRVEHLLQLEAGPEGADRREPAAKAPPGLLAEMFEIQEALQEARGGGLDEAGRATLRELRARLEARCRAEEERLRGPLARAWDSAATTERTAVLAACADALSTRAYLRTVIDDLAQALGEEQHPPVALGEEREPHVAHHRD